MEHDLNNTEHLVRGLKQGTSEAYSFLVNKYHHTLCTYAFTLVGDHDSAEDIVQNVLIRVWKKRKELKDDLDLKNYLYKSVYNNFIDHYRKMRPAFALEKIHIDSLRDYIHEEPDNAMEALIAIVKREIDNLPPKCREAFLLSKQEGLTNMEIAEYLNISIKSVEGHITKAFSILRKALGNTVHHIFMFLLHTGNLNTGLTLKTV
ncbi:RNA polymerase sigma factor [Sinomicrobium oceani]|uniref:RNA polymerase sigma factor n=1 Tax=Sinomicrobium oceani TaxID=1150368 RepID=UPI00227A5BC6|nr:RNA polymerase sigma-70 factor [Sinomicrobium oceani]